MQVNNTIFNSIKDDFLALQNTLSENADYENVSILIEISKGKNFRLSKSGTIIKDNMFSNSGAVIRLNSKKGTYEYSFNDFSKDFLKNIPDLIAENISKINIKNEVILKNNLESFKESIDDNEISENPEIPQNKLTFNKSSEMLKDPDSLKDTELTDYLSKIHNHAMAYDDKIIDCVCVFQYLKIHKYFISDEKDIQQHLMWSTGLIEPLSMKEGKTHYYLKSFSALGGAEILDEMYDTVENACKVAIELLDSEAPVPGKYTVICTPDVTGLIAHEAFGHGVEMDMFVKDRALAKNFIGQPIASNLVTMHDNALSYDQAATYFFDDEGTLSHDTVIIKDGILKKGINDLLSANILGVEPTGNGRRESYERKVYTRMTNTYFEPGDSTLEEMIASVEDGMLLDNGASGMEDPKNWGIQCMVNVGREIKNGKLTGKIFSPVCLSGYVPDLLKSISMVGNDLKLSGSGYCGKGYKEWVKVSDGGAAIKAEVTLS